MSETVFVRVERDTLDPAPRGGRWAHMRAARPIYARLDADAYMSRFADMAPHRSRWRATPGAEKHRLSERREAAPIEPDSGGQ